MWLILIAIRFHFMRHGVILPFIPLLTVNMGAGPSTIGFIVGAFNLIAALLSIPLGGLVDRFGVKPLLLFGVVCNIANGLILLHTNTIARLIAAQIVAGVGFFTARRRQSGLHLAVYRSFPAGKRIWLAQFWCRWTYRRSTLTRAGGSAIETAISLFNGRQVSK